MSYDAVLTEAEFAKFTPNAEVVRYLEVTRQRLGLEKSDMNVLDWGSGRGEYVTWLRAAGYNAFGAEIRRAAAERGKDLIHRRGHDYDRVIRPIAPDCRTDLPASFFHFVFTHYVLEHVADIDAVTREIARLTAPGGCGFHVYPGKLRLVEPHLFMPFVHWLPKRAIRKWRSAAASPAALSRGGIGLRRRPLAPGRRLITSSATTRRSIGGSGRCAAASTGSV